MVRPFYLKDKWKVQKLTESINATDTNDKKDKNSSTYHVKSTTPKLQISTFLVYEPLPLFNKISGAT